MIVVEANENEYVIEVRESGQESQRMTSNVKQTNESGLRYDVLCGIHYDNTEQYDSEERPRSDGSSTVNCNVTR